MDALLGFLMVSLFFLQKIHYFLKLYFIFYLYVSFKSMCSLPFHRCTEAILKIILSADVINVVRVKL